MRVEMSHSNAQNDVKEICYAEGNGWQCDRTAFATGVCKAHYQQRYRGKPWRPLRGYKQCR